MLQKSVGSASDHTNLQLGYPLRQPPSGSNAIVVSRALLCMAAGGALALVFHIGKEHGHGQAAGVARIEGACMALELASTHGVLSDVYRKKLLRAFTSPLNPLQDAFPKSVEAMQSECDAYRSRLTESWHRAHVLTSMK